MINMLPLCFTQDSQKVVTERLLNTDLKAYLYFEHSAYVKNYDPFERAFSLFDGLTVINHYSGIIIKKPIAEIVMSATRPGKQQ